MGLLGRDVVGMVIHDVTAERRESYLVDWAGVRIGGGGGVDASEGWRKGVLIVEEVSGRAPFGFVDFCSGLGVFKISFSFMGLIAAAMTV